MDNLKPLLSRKFIYAMLSVTLAFVLVCLDRVQAKEFLTFVEVIGFTYILGNVATKFVPNGK